MVKAKTVNSWGLEAIGYDLDSDGVTVAKVFCNTCRSVYGEMPHLPMTDNLRGAVGTIADKWIHGTTNIKKCNAIDHISKSSIHQQAVRKVRQKNDVHQPTIPQIAAKINISQISQLTKKFQLVHFLAYNHRPLTDYTSFSKFEKEVHGVDLGSSYQTANAAKKMIDFIANEITSEEITNPLNEGTCRYFSIFYDGSSSAKTMDEKEVYVMKTCKTGSPAFNIISLEEPSSCDAQGLKKSLHTSMKKMKFTFERKDRQIGNGSDGAAVNDALFCLEKQDLGDHLIKGWCLNHKGELGMHDAFKHSALNQELESVMNNIFYLFKKANLKWRLFKRQAKHMGFKALRFKRVTGTRWTAHQMKASDNFVRNLPTLLGFLNHQIALPSNYSMKQAKTTLQGHLKATSKLDIMLFAAVREDILMYRYLTPFSKALERQKLLVPSAFAIIKNSIDEVSKVRRVLEEKGTNAFQCEESFPMVAKHIWPHLKPDRTRSLFRHTRQDEDPQKPDVQAFHGYSLTMSLEAALKKVYSEVVVILRSIEENLQARYADFLDHPVFRAAAKFLDTKTYQFQTAEEIFESVEVLVKHFHRVLLANSCEISKLNQEFNCLYNHVKLFLSRSKNESTWQNLFSSKSELCIVNILHLAEICMVLPISSADVERVFSTFSKTVTKERLSLSNKTIENLLIIRCNNFDGFSADRYRPVIHKFLNQHPNGSVRARKPRMK